MFRRQANHQAPYFVERYRSELHYRTTSREPIQICLKKRWKHSDGCDTFPVHQYAARARGAFEW
jgi:hypothetical protein